MTRHDGGPCLGCDKPIPRANWWGLQGVCTACTERLERIGGPLTGYRDAAAPVGQGA